MSYRLKRATLAALGGLSVFLFASPPALAERPDTEGWSQVASPSGHFLVHYRASAVPAANASAAARNFDSAYATEVEGWGFRAPLRDKDGLIDVYIAATGSHLGEAYHDDPAAPTTSGYVILGPGSAADPQTAAHELFHLIQYAIYAHGAKFLVEGTAEWAGANVARRTGWLLTYWQAPDQPLECAPGSACAPSPEDDRSYSRWIFFNYLSERYSPGIVSEILQRAGALNAQRDPALDLQAVDDVLGAHGSSLSEEFDAFTAANAGGGYSFPGLSGAGQAPRPSMATYTGVSASTLPDQSFSVDHLAAAYTSFASGDTRFSNAGCGAATLHLRVSVAPGSDSQPVVADGDGLHKLGVSGDQASIDLPWTTCTGHTALLALPNASRTLDGAGFVVRSQVTATPPKIRRATRAPRITLRVPRLASVASGRPALRFNVRASRRGTLTALLRPGYVRGEFKLHRGLNRLKLRLPRGLRAGRHQLVVTAYSTTGTRGKTLRRYISSR